MKKYISKKWRAIQWYNKVMIVTVGVVLALSPVVIVPLGIGLEIAYRGFRTAVVAFESIFNGGIASVEALSFEFIGFVVGVAVIPMTVAITGRVMSKKSKKPSGNRDGMKYEA